MPLQRTSRMSTGVNRQPLSMMILAREIFHLPKAWKMALNSSSAPMNTMVYVQTSRKYTAVSTARSSVTNRRTMGLGNRCTNTSARAT